MSPESQQPFSDQDVASLFSALGGSIDRVLQSTNSVKIRGLGVFRKGEDGITFEAADDLESFVNSDFEGLDVVSYDPSDLARSHLKREEFSFEEEEFTTKPKESEIITPVVLSTDNLEVDVLETEDGIAAEALEVAEVELVEEELVQEETLDEEEVVEDNIVEENVVEEIVEEEIAAEENFETEEFPEDNESNPFDIEKEPIDLSDEEKKIEDKLETDEIQDIVIPDDTEQVIEIEEELDKEIELVSDSDLEKVAEEEQLEEIKSDLAPDLEEVPEIEDLPEVETSDEEIASEEEKWLPKDDPEWLKEEEQQSKPFVLPIKKSEKDFAEKGDQKIRERRENARIQRKLQKKRRFWISILGLLFVLAALSLFWWLINTGTLQNPLDNSSRSDDSVSARSGQNEMALDEEVPESNMQDTLYLGIPIIDYSDPNSAADLDRGKYTWILYSSNQKNDALARSKLYSDSGFENDVIKVNLRGLDTYRVSFGRYSGFREATEADSTLPNGIQGTWVDKLEDSFNLSQAVK